MAKSKAKKQKQLYLSLLVGSFLVFAISAVFASRKIIFPWEKSLLLSIYRWPNDLRGLGLLITHFGSAWILVGVTLWLLIGHSRQQHIGRLVVVNGAITYVLVEVAKHLVARPRPAVLISEIQQRDLFVRGFGFPSGHTAMATVISLTLLPFLPGKWRWLPVIWICLVGLSRMYLGVHAPLDIIGGLSIGLIVFSSERLLKVR